MVNSDTGEVLNVLFIYSMWQMLLLVTLGNGRDVESCTHSGEAAGRILQRSNIGKIFTPSFTSVLLGLITLARSDRKHVLGESEEN